MQMGMDLSELAARLTKPLRCLWVSQQSRIWLNQVATPEELDFTPLVLVSASDPAAARERCQLGVHTLASLHLCCQRLHVH